MDANTILHRAEGVAFEVVADEAILIRLDTGTYFSMNKIGTEFWQMLDGKQNIAHHANTLAAKYQVEPSIVLTDLLEIAQEMAGEKLVNSKQ